MEKIFILIFIWHFIFFAEGSCDNFKTDVVLLIAPMIIVKYIRENVFKNKLTRVFFFLVVQNEVSFLKIGSCIMKLQAQLYYFWNGRRMNYNPTFRK